ncbi:MAG: flavodoxin family protein [Deltaproteobacteria bacterium]|jgi:multimeric flavodoxin WrbA|nr:flavodoxin family protein [Deltaproteobacteria bacterium]
MKILALNATYRPGKTTTHLTRKALEGAASVGAETEMVMLRDKDIQFCTNCLTCYKDLDSEIAPCTIDDDVSEILGKIRDADGIILSSPVHCGFVTGLMMAFIERITFRLCRPTGEYMGLKGCPEPRLTGKARPLATIVSAGGMPIEMRQYCDMGTPWLKEAAVFFNGECIGDIYAGAVFNKALEDEDWPKSFLFRELTEEQLQEAFDLGIKMGEATKTGKARPFDPEILMNTSDRSD